MGNVLEAFATGNLTVEPAIYEGSEEYNKARELYCSLGEELHAKLNAEERELLDRYTDAHLEESYLYSMDRFVTGYRLGVLMMMEVFNGREAFMQKEGA